MIIKQFRFFCNIPITAHHKMQHKIQCTESQKIFTRGMRSHGPYVGTRQLAYIRANRFGRDVDLRARSFAR